MDLNFFVHARDIPSRAAVFSNAALSTDIYDLKWLANFYFLLYLFNPCLCERVLPGLTLTRQAMYI